MHYTQARTSTVLTLTVRDPDTGKFPVPDAVKVTVSVYRLGNVPHIGPQETPVVIGDREKGIGNRDETETPFPIVYDQLPIDPATVFHFGVPNFRHRFPAGDESPFQIRNQSYLVRYAITSPSDTVEEYPVRVETLG